MQTDVYGTPSDDAMDEEFVPKYLEGLNKKAKTTHPPPPPPRARYVTDLGAGEVPKEVSDLFA